MKHPLPTCVLLLGPSVNPSSMLATNHLHCLVTVSGLFFAFEVARGFRRDIRTLPMCLFISGTSAPHVLDPDPPIHALPEPEFVEKLRAFNGTPDAVLETPELRQVFLPMLRADFTLRETYTYTPEPPLECPITAFGGIDDPEVSQDDLEAWKEHTSTSFQSSMLPGDHFFLHTSKHALLQKVSLELVQYVQRLSRLRRPGPQPWRRHHDNAFSNNLER